jgi:hypothetical protein
MKKIVIRIMKANGFVNVEEKDGMLIFHDEDYESGFQIIIGRGMLEKAVQIIKSRAEAYGRSIGKCEVYKIISDYKQLMQ